MFDRCRQDSRGLHPSNWQPFRRRDAPAYSLRMPKASFWLAFGYFVLAPTVRLNDGDEASCCPATRYAIALEMQVYIIPGAMQLAKQK